jgi:hypothetical protein
LYSANASADSVFRGEEANVALDEFSAAPSKLMAAAGPLFNAFLKQQASGALDNNNDEHSEDGRAARWRSGQFRAPLNPQSPAGLWHLRVAAVNLVSLRDSLVNSAQGAQPPSILPSAWTLDAAAAAAEDPRAAAAASLWCDAADAAIPSLPLASAFCSAPLEPSEMLLVHRTRNADSRDSGTVSLPSITWTVTAVPDAPRRYSRLRLSLRPLQPRAALPLSSELQFALPRRSFLAAVYLEQTLHASQRITLQLSDATAHATLDSLLLLEGNSSVTVALIPIEPPQPAMEADTALTQLFFALSAVVERASCGPPPRVAEPVSTIIVPAPRPDGFAESADRLYPIGSVQRFACPPSMQISGGSDALCRAATGWDFSKPTCRSQQTNTQPTGKRTRPQHMLTSLSLSFFFSLCLSLSLSLLVFPLCVFVSDVTCGRLPNPNRVELSSNVTLGGTVVNVVCPPRFVPRASSPVSFFCNASSGWVAVPAVGESLLSLTPECAPDATVCLQDEEQCAGAWAESSCTEPRLASNHTLVPSSCRWCNERCVPARSCWSTEVQQQTSTCDAQPTVAPTDLQTLGGQQTQTGSMLRR